MCETGIGGYETQQYEKPNDGLTDRKPLDVQEVIVQSFILKR